jgi:hypothetical protein
VPRGLDHIVHAVRDLDAAAKLYHTLGFQVGARNWHPRAWGTQNQIVQLAGTFVELLSVADASGIVPHALRHFSFGAFNRDFLTREQGTGQGKGQGLSMLVLAGRGAPDADEFRSKGIGDFDLCEFEREGKRPDGTSIKVAFTLAFAADPRAPETGFFTCLHRRPEYFWNPAFQVHANTAAGVVGVVLVAECPSDHQSFLAAFTGARGVVPATGTLNITTERGEIQVMTPGNFSENYGVAPPDVSRGARLAALRFAVRDMDAASRLLASAQAVPSERMGRLILGPDAVMGAVLVFEQARS